MDNQEKKEETLTAKPFLLRPSALGSSPGAFGSSFHSDNKPSLLRPSKLTAIADQIENSSSETKKRKADNEHHQDLAEEDNEAASKKLKNDEGLKSRSPRSLELNEELVQPQGIGTFGFGKKNDSQNNKATNPNQNSNSSSSSTSVFGQNINERVTGFQEIKKQSQPTTEEEFVEKQSGSEEEQENKLALNASEHMKQEESTKLHLKEVELITGEEGERNVMHVHCKLHLFNKEKTSWVEKGRGIIKLNDICQSQVDGIFQSRIVFRTNGSHLVVLNTLLWPEMCYDKASVKSLRFTAIHPETKQIKVYLITAAPKDILQFHTAIDQRILALKRNQQEASTGSQSEESCDAKPEGDALEAEKESCQSQNSAETTGQEPENSSVNIENEASNSKESDSDKSNDSLASEP